jgi:GNAT superfamily N-acetyltransferase
MSFHLAQSTVADFFDDPAAAALLDEYANECALAGLPPPCPHRGIYEALEKSGAMTLIVVRDDEEDRLVGALLLLVSMNPHYSQILGTTESIFVTKEYRPKGAGAALLREAEKLSRLKGAVGLLISAPVGSQFARVLGKSTSFEYTNQVFVKVLS